MFFAQKSNLLVKNQTFWSKVQFFVTNQNHRSNIKILDQKSKCYVKKSKCYVKKSKFFVKNQNVRSKKIKMLGQENQSSLSKIKMLGQKKNQNLR